MNTIPQEFQINELLNQDTYLVDGELKKWTGPTTTSGPPTPPPPCPGKGT